MKKNILLGTLLLTMVTAGARSDPVSITFDNSPVPGTAGSTVSFYATMTNTTGEMLNLNSDSFTLASPFTEADVDDTDFWNDWPTSLGAGESYGPEVLFTIDIPTGTAPGLYSETFDLLGGPGMSDENLLGAEDFQVNVLSPEPGAFSLLLLGAASLFSARYLRRHSLKA